jgi:hypothetical protein
MLALHILLGRYIGYNRYKGWEQEFKISLYTSHSLSRKAEESNKESMKRKRKKDKTQEDQVQGEKETTIQGREDLEYRAKESPHLEEMERH